MASTELVMFAINTAVKLGGAARKHYVASTQSRDITFPLPDSIGQPDITSALNFFLEPTRGAKYLDTVDFLKIHIKPHVQLSVAHIEERLDSTQRATLLRCYKNYYVVFDARNRLVYGNDEVSAVELETMLQISQWQEGDSPHPTLLMRVAGNLVDVAVDYFLQVPEAFSKEGKNGKAIEAVLTGLDKIQFTDAIEPQNLGDLPQRLLIVTLETVSENSEHIISEPRFQELVSIATSSLAKDINTKIKQIDANGETDSVVLRDKKQQTIKWGEFVFRSVLSSAGRAMVEQPQKFLKQSDAAQQDLTTTVAGALLDAILADDSQSIFQAGLNQKTLERLMLASIEVIGRHPDLIVADGIKHRKAITAIVQSTAAELGSQAALFGDDMVANVTRLILENTGENLELFWPDIDNNPKKNLLVKVAKIVIEILAEEPPFAAKWKPKFTRNDIDALLQFVLEEVVTYPNWLIEEVGELNDNLTLALEAIVGSLRKMERPMISSANVTSLIKVGLQAVIMNQAFVKRMQDERLPIEALYDVLFDEISGQNNDMKVQWKNLRVTVIERVLEEVSTIIAEKGVDENLIQVVENAFKVSLLQQTKLDIDTLIHDIQQAIENAN
jgi:hypothetical protein